MVLAYQASDARSTPGRLERTARRLRELPHHVMPAGLCASYSEECIRFVRIYDVDDHDPAVTAREKQEFVRRMTTLFHEGHIWGDPENLKAEVCEESRCIGVDERQSQTCLNMVLEQARRTPTIYYQDGRQCTCIRKLR